MAERISGNVPLKTLSREELKVLLVNNPKTGERDYLNLQAQCVATFGAAAGIMMRQFVFLTGRSKLDGGWFWKKRDEGCKETGLGHREWDKGKKILLGEKAWAGRTVKVLEERRPSRRAAAEYRVDLVALAEVLNVKASTRLAADESPTIAKSPCEATKATPNANQSPLRKATEWPRAAAEPLRKATESLRSGQPQRRHQERTPKTTSKGITLQGGADGSSSRLAPRTDKSDSPLLAGGGDAAPRSLAAPQANHIGQRADSQIDSYYFPAPDRNTRQAEARLRRVLEDPPQQLRDDLARYRAGDLDLVEFTEKVRPHLSGTVYWGLLTTHRLAEKVEMHIS